MTTAPQKPALFRQLWQAILEVSEAAVALHYAAPWDAAAPQPKRERGAAREIAPSIMRRTARA
jgi:hypothetical protein